MKHVLTVLTASLALTACVTDEVATVPVDATSALEAAQANTQTHIDAVLELTADFRRAGWVPERFDDQGDVADAMRIDSGMGAELAARIGELLRPERLESNTTTSLVYRVEPQWLCGDDPPYTDDCHDAVKRNPLRIRVTAPIEGDVDLALLVGASRINPLTIGLHRSGLEAKLDLGAAAQAMNAIGTLEAGELNADATGILHAAIDRRGPTGYAIEFAVQRAIDLRMAIGDERLTATTGVSSILVRLDSMLVEPVLLDLAIGALNVRFEDGRCDDDCGQERTTAFEMPGLTGLIAQASANQVRLKNFGLSGPLTFDFNGERAFSFDPNPSRNGIDLEVEQNDGLVDLLLYHAITLSASVDTDVLAKFDEDRQGEGIQTLSMAVNGNRPHLQFEGEQTRVVDGALRIEMTDREPVEARAGECMASLEDGPEVIVCQ